MDGLKKFYGPMVQPSPEPGYNFTLGVDVTKVTEANREGIADKISLVKRHIFAGPFNRVFDDIEAGKTKGILQVAYRDEETLFIKPEQERCIVIFTVYFRDRAVIANVFLNSSAMPARPSPTRWPCSGRSRR